MTLLVRSCAYMVIMCTGVTSRMSMCFMGMVFVRLVFIMCVWCDCCSINFIFMSMMFMMVVVLVTCCVIVFFFMVVMEAMVVNTSSIERDVTQCAMLMRDQALKPYLVLLGKCQI